MEHSHLIEQVWNRANKVQGYGESDWRTDPFGSPILWSDYGNKESRYGWVLKRLRNGTAEAESRAEDFHAVQWQNT